VPLSHANAGGTLGIRQRAGDRLGGCFGGSSHGTHRGHDNLTGLGFDTSRRLGQRAVELAFELIQPRLHVAFEIVAQGNEASPQAAE